MGKKNILVSVVVPVYNVEKYLKITLDCLAKQSHKNIEVILVDDGSKDSSGKIADAYATADCRFRVIHVENGGVSNARNIGIDNAKGDYICFSDADDLLSEDYVDYLLNLAITYDADIAMTRDMFNSYRLKQNYNAEKIEVLAPHEAAKGFLYYYYPIGCYSKIFKTTFLNSGIRFVPEIFVGEGFNFNMATLQRANKVVVGYKRVYTYRLDNDISCMTAFNRRKVECGVYALDRIKRDLLFTDKTMLDAWEYAYWATVCSMWVFIKVGKAEKEVPELAKEYRHIMKSKAHYAFTAPISVKEKIHAVMMVICPSLFHNLRQWRRQIIGRVKSLAKLSR